MDPILRIGADTGGTFTDLLAVRESGRFEAVKLPSTPDAPERAIVAALCRIDGAGEAALVHGTTVATNALLEGRGAATALIATRGFRDVLRIARQTREELYSLHVPPRQPLIPPELCFEVEERIGATGEVVVALDRESVLHALREAKAGGASSVAVSLLFSFLNPEHERAIGEEALRMGLVVSLSSEIAPRYREYERTATTCACARVATILGGYLERLKRALPMAIGRRLSVMRSDGGSMRAEEAARNAAMTVLSGPAGGAMAAAECARALGIQRAISFDMGGTSTDICLIDGEPRRSAETSVASVPLLIPCLEMETVGAGGGSIAWADPGGALQVGPRSAGAVPGPAAYGIGDDLAITDAHILLGRLPAEARLAGSVDLDRDRVRGLFEAFAARLGTSAEEAAEGILRVADARMARAIRRASLSRGHDPKDFALVAFGGAGGLHACRLAAELGMRTVVTPLLPGLFSACGLAAASPRREIARSIAPVAPDARKETELRGSILTMGRALSEELASEGEAGGKPRIAGYLEMRYAGQTAALRVPFGRSLSASEGAFHRLYRREFGHADSALPVEVVAVGAIGVAPIPPRPLVASLPAKPGQPIREAMAWLGGCSRSCWVYERMSLAVGQIVEGPAIVIQPDATLFVEAGWQARVAASGDLALTR